MSERETCKRCSGSGLRWPKTAMRPHGPNNEMIEVPMPFYSEGARCVPCGGTGKVRRAD